MSNNTKRNSVRTREIMNRDVVTVFPDDSIHEALVLLVENRVSAVPVVDRRGRCIGMLSTTDMIDLTRELDDELCRMDESDVISRVWMMNLLGDGIGNERVDSVMTERVASVHVEASVQDATRIVLRNRVHRLPVVDEDGKVVGIISTMDLLNSLISED